jgi:hypothetical protein
VNCGLTPDLSGNGERNPAGSAWSANHRIKMPRSACAVIVFVGVAVLVAVAPASAQIAPQSGCADCHYTDPRSPRRDHLEAWDRPPTHERTLVARAATAGILEHSRVSSHMPGY